MSHHVHCSRCGAAVSNPLPVEVIVRAWVECPECVAADGQAVTG